MSKKVRKVSRIDDPNIEAQIDEIIRVVNSLDVRTEDADTKATVNTQPGMVFREFPSDPVFGNCEFVYDVTLRWYKAEGAIMYEIRTDLNWGNESGRVYLGSALQYSFIPGQRYYTFYIKSINPAGKYSQGYDEIILEKPVPSIPNPPETKPFFSAVKIIPAPNHEQGILGHYAYVTIEGETDKVDIPIGSSHVYNAPSGTEMTIEMSAYDILGEGGKSAPVTASTLKLSDRDIPEEIIEPSNLVESLREDIDLTKTRAIDALAQISDLDSIVDDTIADLNAAKDRLTSAETEITGAKNRLDSVETEVAGAKSRLSDAEDKLGTIDVEIAEAKDRISDAEAELINIDGTLTTHNQKITNIEGELSSKVSQTDFNALAGTVTEHSTLISQTAEAIETKADKSTVDALTGRVNAAEATLSTHADEIAARATKEEVDTLEGRVTAAEGQLSVQAGKIEAKAEKSEVQALEEDLSAISTQVGTLITSYDSISARVEAVEGVTDDLTGEVSDVKSITGSLEVRAGNIEASVSRLEEDIDEHGNRLATVENAVVEVLPGQIALKADASIVDEQGTRITTAEQQISALDGAITQAVTRINQSAILKPSGGKLWHFDTGLVSTDGIKPLDGSVATLRPGEGRFGGAVAVEERTENLAYNPTFSGAVGGDAPLGYGLSTQGTVPDIAKLVQSPWGTQGVLAYHVKVNAARAYLSLYSAHRRHIEAAEGDIFTISFYATSNDVEVWYRILDDDLSTVRAVTNASFTNTNGDQYVHVTDPLPAGARYFYVERIGIGVNDRRTGEAIFERLQVEKKPFATSFVDGTRAAGRLVYPTSVFNPAQGTISMWVRKHQLIDYSARVFWSDSGSYRFGIHDFPNGSLVWAYATSDNQYTGGFLTPGKWHHLVMTWHRDEGWMRGYLDGEPVALRTFDPGTDPGFVYSNTWGLGARVNGSLVFNGLFDELLILPYAATDAEIKAWYESGKPFIDQDEINTVKIDVATLTTNYDSIIARVESTEGDIDALTGEITGVKSRTSTLEQRADGFDAKVQAIESDVDGLDGRLSTAESNISANASAIELRATKSEVQDVSGKVSNLETWKGQFSVTPANINATVSAVNDSSTGLSAAWSEINQTPTKISQAVASLRSDIDDAIADVYSDISQTASSINSTISSLQTNLEGQIAAGDSALSGQISAIEQTLSGITSTVSDLGGELGDISTQVTQLADRYSVKTQKTSGGKTYATGFVSGINEQNESEFAVLADRFRVFGSLDEEGDGTALFVVDAQTNKAYLNVEEVIAAGAIKAEHLEADSVLAYLVQAGFAQFDEANVLDLLVDRRIRVGDNLEIGGNRIVVEGDVLVEETIWITEDTYVDGEDSTYANRNYSYHTRLHFYGDVPTHTLLKFNLPSGNITSATLRLYGWVDDFGPFYIRVLKGDWNYQTVTWNNKPASDLVITTPPYQGVEDYQWIEIDITPVVQLWKQGQQNYGIEIYHDHDTSAYSSRYSNPAYHPHVVFTVYKESKAVLGDLGGLPWLGETLPAGTSGMFAKNAYITGKFAVEQDDKLLAELYKDELGGKLKINSFDGTVVATIGAKNLRPEWEFAEFAGEIVLYNAYQEAIFRAGADSYGIDGDNEISVLEMRSPILPGVHSKLRFEVEEDAARVIAQASVGAVTLDTNGTRFWVAGSDEYVPLNAIGGTYTGNGATNRIVSVVPGPFYHFPRVVIVTENSTGRSWIIGPSRALRLQSGSSPVVTTSVRISGTNFIVSGAEGNSSGQTYNYMLV